MKTEILSDRKCHAAEAPWESAREIKREECGQRTLHVGRRGNEDRCLVRSCRRSGAGAHAPSQSPA